MHCTNMFHFQRTLNDSLIAEEIRKRILEDRDALKPKEGETDDEKALREHLAGKLVSVTVQLHNDLWPQGSN